MFQGQREIYQLAYLLAELTVIVRNQEDRLSQNSEAIEAVVSELQGAVSTINAKIDALTAANAAGEDLTQPLADLKAAADAVAAIAPAAPADASETPAS